MTGTTDPSGFLRGAQIGFNWQAGAFVFGIEGDWSWTNADGSTTLYPCASSTMRAQLVRDRYRPRRLRGRQLALVRQGRRRLADADYTIAGVTGSQRDPHGWTIGTGLEWALAPNWSAKIEYNYLDFGNETHRHDHPFDADTQVHLVKLGLNYRFDWGKAPSSRGTDPPSYRQKTPGLGPGFLFVLRCVFSLAWQPRFARCDRRDRLFVRRKIRGDPGLFRRRERCAERRSLFDPARS